MVAAYWCKKKKNRRTEHGEYAFAVYSEEFLCGTCLIYLFLAGLRPSQFSLETASVLSHSNLKIEYVPIRLYSCDGRYKFWPL